MTFTTDQVLFFFSGGSQNRFTELSLGGEPSEFPVPSNQNNLFDDSNLNLRGDDKTDFRCIYLFNKSVGLVTGTKVWLDSQAEGGSDIELGVRIANEKQRVTINADSIVGGSTTFSFNEVEFSFSHDSDVATWASNFETALNALDALSTTTVTGSTFLTTTIFDVDFLSSDGSRRHPVIEFVSHTLTGSGIDDPVIAVLEKGGPINDIAPDIDLATSPPGNIEFLFSDVDNPFIIGTLNPNEGLPIWVKRETTGDSEFLADNFSIKASGVGFSGSYSAAEYSSAFDI
jgi:hypothetical protein